MYVKVTDDLGAASAGVGGGAADLCVRNLGRARSRGEGFAAFRESVVSAGQGTPHVSLMDSDLGRVREFLRSENGPDDLAIPDALNQATIKGCRILEWNGRNGSLICLRLKDAGRVGLFVVRDVGRDVGRDSTGPGAEPILAQVGPMNTISWSRDGRTYMLAANATDKELKRLLSA